MIFYTLCVAEYTKSIPQILKLLKTKHSSDFSIASELISLTLEFGWLMYWILTESSVGQLIASTVILLLVLFKVFLVLYYQKVSVSGNKK